ncbi:hypothetical protein AALP_AA6G239500 [Arabis alpina]|uniref:Knottin scorpion toxin-like domain-containing protein n=1 Tax=Arabis alpina TaxID=50452 RepID=A0A087GRB5_ARAAL|nr:hypothetical protein AALP_AA6G239500 [Arabis alpina]
MMKKSFQVSFIVLTIFTILLQGVLGKVRPVRRTCRDFITVQTAKCNDTTCRTDCDQKKAPATAHGFCDPKLNECNCIYSCYKT